MSIKEYPYLTFLSKDNPVIITTVVEDIYIEPDSLPRYITRLNPPAFSAEAEIELECELSSEGLNRLFGLDLASGSDITNASVTFKSTQEKQIKRHKKKRINKKWNKRYGPKYIFYSKQCALNDVTIHRSEDSIDILGYKPDFIF